MSSLKVAAIIVLLAFGMSVTGCGIVGHKDQIDQADDALKKGNVNGAIKTTRNLLRLYPRNLWANRMMKKIEAHVLKEAQEAFEAEDYKLASSKADLVLKVNPENEQAKSIEKNAEKHMALQEARQFMEAGNPVNAMKSLNRALTVDPQFKEALDMKAEVDKIVEEQINSFLGSAEEMMEQGKFQAVETMAQGILAIAPQNREIADLLHRAKAAMLQQDKEQNLIRMRKFYEEGLYESAIEYSEKVLKVDENNEEAKKMVENCKAELQKPEVRLTGFLKIKGKVYASMLIGGKDKFKVQEGEEFGDFKLSAIDLDLDAVVVTYLKTGSQQTIIKE